MLLPQKYKWIQSIGLLPKMVSIGLNLLGTREIPGIKSNPIILSMARSLGLEKIYTNDDTSWCALFMSYVATAAGKPLPDNHGDIYNLLRARWFLEFGVPVEPGQIMFGDVVVINRPGGGHVGLYIAESQNTYHLLGGNQSNAVTITEVHKDRLLGARRFYAIKAPESVKKYFLDSSGRVSTNEA